MLARVVYHLNYTIFIKNQLNLLKVIKCVCGDLEIMKSETVEQIVGLVFKFRVVIINTINVYLFYYFTFELISNRASSL